MAGFPFIGGIKASLLTVWTSYPVLLTFDSNVKAQETNNNNFKMQNWYDNVVKSIILTWCYGVDGVSEFISFVHSRWKEGCINRRRIQAWEFKE